MKIKVYNEKRSRIVNILKSMKITVNGGSWRDDNEYEDTRTLGECGADIYSVAEKILSKFGINKPSEK